jgi:hypothetical protein
MGHDSLRGVTVLFGGHNPVANAGLYNDTWEHNGRIWLKRTPTDFEGDGNPIGRTMPALAFDERRGVTVMFGGCVAYQPTVARDWMCSTVSDELWEWDGERWQLRCDGVPAADACASTPPARFAAAGAYDAERGVFALYGGCLNGDCTSIDDSLWLWDGNDWSERSAQAPGALYGSSAAFDRQARDLVLFGGAGSGSDGALASAASWIWDGSTWTSATPFVSGRLFGAVTYDRGRNQLVRFGGMETVHACDPNSPMSTDTALYGWNGSAWQDLGVPSTGLASFRQWCLGLAHQTSSDRTLLAANYYFAGGYELSSSMTTAWERGGSWSGARQDAIPPLPRRAAGVYDPVEGPLVIGGLHFNGTSWATSSWAWVVGSQGWYPCDGPSGSAGYPCDTLRLLDQRIVFDSTYGRVVTHGGESSGPVSTTHTWDWMNMQWQTVSTTGFPPQRYRHAFTGAPGGVLVTFGGMDKDGGAMASTCTLSSTTWTCPSLVSGVTEPGARWGLAAAYHQTADLVVAFGGMWGDGLTPSANQLLDDTWVFDGTRWYEETAPGPLARLDHIMAYDAGREEIVMAFGENKDDTWAFRPGAAPGQGAWHQIVPADPEWDGQPRQVEYPVSWVAPEGIVVAGYFGGDDTPEFWLYRGNGDQRPAAMLQVRVGSQVRLDAQRVDALEITWVGGASGDVSGADLFLWRDDGWQLLTDSAIATADAPETLSLVVEDASDPDWADAILVGEPAAIYLALVPKGVNANLPDYARVATDYVEARLRLSSR